MYGKNKYFIDVTQEICPITFVKVKIKLESMPSGKVLEVKCRGKEAFENISKSALINSIFSNESSDRSAIKCNVSLGIMSAGAPMYKDWESPASEVPDTWQTS